jgi:pimeloyl-ACP methyl ester carboxylesterase
MAPVNTVQSQSRRFVQRQAWGDVVWHIWGEGGSKKPPLVLFHGGSGSWTHWVRNVIHLAKQREVWAMDLPGFGDSSLPPNVRDADDLAPYVARILAATFGARAVDVVGFSFGGLTAGLVAAHNPEVIRRLFLVGVPGLGLMREALPMRGMLPEMSNLQRAAVHRHNLRVMMVSDEAQIDEALIELQEANVVRDNMRRRKIARTDVLLQVQHQWQCPVHGLWGDKDALYHSNLQRIPEVLTRLNSFHLIANAGHWVAYEQPEAFHLVLDQLLGQSN